MATKAIDCKNVRHCVRRQVRAPPLVEKELVITLEEALQGSSDLLQSHRSLHHGRLPLYYYILELDDAGEIIGGDCVYNSDSDRPDFLRFTKVKPAADTVTSIG
ncbi:hypothetical protein PHYPSEUDO_011437 [Phytophthora pseudosyringae]|uniref:Uncharacterized protein n=1 Tax=Phytophthora pseudosyringae TaxID=221518 RepID=A0A8T1W9R9_9STRA|nr:hypothetical protein PHYPSEUDO_011437 [Phytophthora pseudosyringae]